MTAPASSHGTVVAFQGVPLGRVTSIKASRSCARLDITGFGSPERVREVVPGDVEPVTINVTAIGPLIAGPGTKGALEVTFPGGGSYAYANAFIESAEVGADAGEFIKSVYTFVAST